MLDSVLDGVIEGILEGMLERVFEEWDVLWSYMIVACEINSAMVSLEVFDSRAIALLAREISLVISLSLCSSDCGSDERGWPSPGTEKLLLVFCARVGAAAAVAAAAAAAAVKGLLFSDATNEPRGVRLVVGAKLVPLETENEFLNRLALSFRCRLVSR